MSKAITKALILTALDTLSDNRNDGGYVGVGELAHACCCTRETLVKHVKELEDELTYSTGRFNAMRRIRRLTKREKAENLAAAMMRDAADAIQVKYEAVVERKGTGHDGGRLWVYPHRDDDEGNVTSKLNLKLDVHGLEPKQVESLMELVTKFLG